MLVVEERGCSGLLLKLYRISMIPRCYGYIEIIRLIERNISLTKIEDTDWNLYPSNDHMNSYEVQLSFASDDYMCPLGVTDNKVYLFRYRTRDLFCSNKVALPGKPFKLESTCHQSNT